jgi:dihydropteroate synthase
MVDPVAEVFTDLERSVQSARAAGIAPSAIVVDPGIGFGKRAEESLLVLRHIGRFSQLEYPLLVGTSRKSFLGRIVQDGPDARLWGTAASVAVSIVQGAHILRVHDVRSMRTFVDALDTLI